MKRLLWLGSFMDEQTCQTMISQGYKNMSSYVSQKNILEGIEVQTGLTFDSVNAVAMAGFPVQGGLSLKSYNYSHKDGAKDVLTGYFNPLYLNKLFMKNSMVRAVKRWISQCYMEGDELDVFIYEMRSACIDSAVYIKKRIPQARIHLIIPDIPFFMDLNMGILKRTLKKIDIDHMIKRFEYITDFIPYTETMVDYLGIRDREWLVMEGSLNKTDIEGITSAVDKVSGSKPDKKIIMYSGWINQQFGIDALVDAMDHLDDSYVLKITGGGPYEQGLREKVKDNPKVDYIGFLPTREELFAVQAQASVMMNMRDPGNEATDYYFPSKLFEYMLVGVPVLSVSSKGIPDEYLKYIYEFKSIEPQQIAQAIENVLDDDQRIEKAKAGRKFIEEEKNNYVMAQKILQFIER